MDAEVCELIVQGRLLGAGCRDRALTESVRMGFIGSSLAGQLAPCCSTTTILRSRRCSDVRTGAL